MKLISTDLSLRKILSASFILISAIPVVFLAYWVQDTALEKEYEAVEEKHLIIAHNLTAAVERYIKDVKGAFRVVASDLDGDSHTTEVYQLLRQLHFDHIWYLHDGESYMVFHNTGDSDNHMFVPNSLEQYILDNPIKNNMFDIKVSGVLPGSEGDPVFGVYTKLKTGQYLVGAVNPEYIHKMQQSIAFGERGHAAVVDQYGKVMAHPVAKWHQTMKDISFLPPVQNMMQGVTGVTQFYTPAMKADMIAGHTVVKNTGWGIMIPQPVQELHDRAAYAQNMALFLAIMGILVASVVSWWLANYIAKTLDGFTTFTENVASGTFTDHIPLQKGVTPKELKRLISSFNRMIDKLKNKTDAFVLLTDRLRQAQNIARLGNWSLSVSDNAMWWSDEVYRILHLKKQDIAAPVLDDLLNLMPDYQKDEFRDLIKKAILTRSQYSIDCQINIKDGEDIFVRQDILVQTDSSNNIIAITGTVQDVSERRLQEEKLNYQAHFDVLTGLPNRQFCLDTIYEELELARNNDGILPLFVLGLDHFKEVNGTLGHLVGDKILKLAASRLTKLVRNFDFIARLGSDEFAIILKDIPNMDVVKTVAENIVEGFQNPFSVEDYEVIVSASVGISVYPHDDALNPLLMFQKADTALHASKAKGRGTYTIFSSEMDEQVLTRMNIRSDMVGALENDEFNLVFQPIVDAQTGKVVCAESLIRWTSPSRGFVPPDKFIPIAEETGYIADIGLWVLDTACKELKKWHDNGFPELYISVNLSLRQIDLGLNKAEILKILDKYSLKPEFLTLEITESLLMDDLDKNLIWLNDVRDSGVRFSIDDFGTGYSSLSYLLNLPVSTLKIDRAFVSNILHGKKDETLIETIITLSKKLDYKIVAEGVETEGQLNKLRSYDCDLIQGYYFSKPLPSDEFISYLVQQNGQENVTNITSLNQKQR